MPKRRELSTTIIHCAGLNGPVINPLTWLNVVFYFLSQSKKIAQKALKTIWKLRDCVVVDKGDDEPVVITSRYLSMVLYRPGNVKNETIIGDAKTKFTLPSYKGLFKRRGLDKTNITSKIVLFKGNPYTWHKSASKGECHEIILT